MSQFLSGLPERLKVRVQEEIDKAVEEKERHLKSKADDVRDNVSSVLIEMLNSPDSKLRAEISTLAQKLKDGVTDKLPLLIAVTAPK